jgi:D-ribose pyranase
LISRVRHTNRLVIADRGFPFWPMIETVDLALVDEVPTVLQVPNAIRPNYSIHEVFMAEEFFTSNPSTVCDLFSINYNGWKVNYTAHVELKKMVPQAVGLIRTGDTVQFADIILVSG